MMRPDLELGLKLVAFCRKNGLPVTGGKIEITSRIVHFLDTGEVLKSTPVHRRLPNSINHIDEDSVIEDNFICSEKHRAFLKEKIGDRFSFNVGFQKWLKNNSGKTYQDAILAYYQILKDKKSEKAEIDKQFEYNTYIRDFFADNQGQTLEETIQCWKYRKLLLGHNQYEKSDLIALEI